MLAKPNRTGIAVAIACAVAAIAGCDGATSSRNTAPEVSLSSSLTLAKAGIAVSFSAGATDAEGNIVDYAWDFGDGTVVSGAGYPAVDHAFAAAGSYTVSVIVTDEEGLTAGGAVIVDVTPAGGPPTLAIERVEVRGRVVDETVHEIVVDGAVAVPLTDGVFTWTDDTFASPAGHTFEAQDEGGNTDARSMTLTEM